MSDSIYALIDCNNFYASCERVFAPSLRDRPVAILSNNDGCVISRSEEAKKVGVKMTAPEFKQRHFFKSHNVAVLSSNYALYGDMSRRVMQTLRNLTPSVEPYSIDEAFLELSRNIDQDWDEYGRTIKDTVWRWTGIPVSVGIAPTKTLAKIANETAKDQPEYNGVLNLVGNPNLDDILKAISVSEIWGIGAGFTQQLFKFGITNGYQLKETLSNKKWVRKHLKVTGLRTVMELNGKPCLEVENVSDPRKGIMTSRSFGEAVTDLHDIKEAAANFVSIAAEKLRAQNSVASVLSVMLRTNKYADPRSRYKFGMERTLHMPTAHTPHLIKCAHACVDELFEQGQRYKKAAVMLTGIISQSEIQADLFEDNTYDEQQHRLMDKLDDINSKYGKRTTMFAGTGIEQPWQMKQQFLSPRFTTRWDELMEVEIT